jgi:tetratricopeptide (TPR) repeat protein
MNPGRADAYSLLGYALLQKGEREYAREMFEAAIKNDPNEDQAYRGLRVYHAASNPRAAIENYEQALKVANPEGPNLFNPDEDYRTVAFLYPKLGQPQLTVKAFERAAQVFLIDEDVQFQYGLALIAADDREKAEVQVRILEQLGHRKLADQLAAKVKAAQ